MSQAQMQAPQQHAPPGSSSGGNAPSGSLQPASAAAAAASSGSSGAAAAPSAPLTNPGEDPAVEQMVLDYLRKRGFSHTEATLRREAAKLSHAADPTAAASAGASAAPSTSQDIHAFAGDVSLDQHTHPSRSILTYSSAESTPDAYTHAYSELSKWVAQLLEPYRIEMRNVLWPIYAHVFIQLIHRGFPQDGQAQPEYKANHPAREAQVFLSRFRPAHEALHSNELHVFQNVLTDSDLQKFDFVKWLQQRQVEVQMSSYSHQLLMAFLDERGFMLIRKIVQENVFLRVTSRKPLSLESDIAPPTSMVSAPSSFSSLNPLAVANLNNTPIRWGMLPDIAELHVEAAQMLRERMRSAQIAAKTARLQEEREAAERRRKAEESKEGAAASAAKEEEGGEGADEKKKDGDTEMADASQPTAGGEDGAAGAAGDKSKKPASKKRKDGAGASAAVETDPLRQSKEEVDAIESAVKKQIRQPEAMAVVKREEKKDGVEERKDTAVKNPPIAPEARARYLADLNSRQRLSPSSLPSICLYTFLNAANAINSLRISDDGSVVSAGMADSTVRVYDLKDPNVRTSTNPAARAAQADSTGDDPLLESTSVYPDMRDGLPGFSPLSSSLLPHKRFVDDPARLPYSKLVGHSGPVYATSLSPEGQHLLSASEDCTVRMWHLETKKNLVIYKGHNYPVWDVAFAPLGFYFATASHDHTARLWSTNSISPLRLFVGHSSDVDVVRFHPNVNYVCTASSDATARLWDVQTGNCVRVLVGHKGPVRALAMDPAGRYAATGGEDGRVLVWDLGSGRQVSDIAAHTAPVTALDYSADAEVLASAALDRTLCILEPKKSQQTQPLRTFHTKRTPVSFLHFTPRNLLLAGGIFQGE